jgi:hypothetical protein
MPLKQSKKSSWRGGNTGGGAMEEDFGSERGGMSQEQSRDGICLRGSLAAITPYRNKGGSRGNSGEEATAVVEVTADCW